MIGALFRDELEGRIFELQSRIGAALAPYKVETAVGHWLDTLRGIEELINLPTVDWGDEPFERQLYALPVLQLTQHMPWFMSIRKRLLERFSEPFVNRFSNLMHQGAAIATSFAANGLAEATSGFQTLGSMIGYLQSAAAPFRRVAAPYANRMPWVAPYRATGHAQHLFAPCGTQRDTNDGCAVRPDGEARAGAPWHSRGCKR
ncbi:hypothetical protein LP415_19300 [Polaromonas sp. P1(28)-8]|nr:hypothetical protein LP415_19300 [Polaromonas sp. P1(28)-8]